MSEVIINDDNFESVIGKAAGALVDFGADWCGPCKMIAPVIEKLAEEYEGKFTVGACNVDNARELAAKFGVRSIPTIIFFKNGQEVDRQVGYMDYNALKAKVDAQL